MKRRYVSFALADGRFCLPVEQVLQIIRREGVIDIPKPPPYVEGVINLRGDIIPVVNLRARLEVSSGERGERREPDPRKRRVVIAKLETRLYGLDVDEVRDIVEIEEESIAAEATELFGSRAEFVAGIARTEAGVFLLLDLPRVLGTGLPGKT